MTNETRAETTPGLGQTALTCLAGIIITFVGLMLLPVPVSPVMLAQPFFAGGLTVIAIDALLRRPLTPEQMIEDPVRVEPVMDASTSPATTS